MRMVGIGFPAIATHFDLGWIFGPLWYAARSFVDDKLALACVAVERLGAGFDAFRRESVPQGENPQFWTPSQSRKVRTALMAALTEASKEAQLTPEQLQVCQRRIEQMGQRTNADKLLDVFDYLRIPVSPCESDTLAKRNVCLNGRRTLEPNGSIEAINEEMIRVDVITMLVHKAMLGLLGYRGPFIDYAPRAAGNFPIEVLG